MRPAYAFSADQCFRSRPSLRPGSSARPESRSPGTSPPAASGNGWTRSDYQSIVTRSPSAPAPIPPPRSHAQLACFAVVRFGLFHFRHGSFSGFRIVLKWHFRLARIALLRLLGQRRFTLREKPAALAAILAPLPSRLQSTYTHSHRLPKCLHSCLSLPGLN